MKNQWTETIETLQEENTKLRGTISSHEICFPCGCRAVIISLGEDKPSAEWKRCNKHKDNKDLGEV